MEQKILFDDGAYLRSERLAAADETMRHKVFATILKIGCGDYDTTQGKDQINQAIDQFLDTLVKEGCLKI